MNSNIGNLFSGNFYIHKGYGISLLPVLIQSFAGVSFVEKKLEDLTSNVITKVGTQKTISSDNPSTENKIVAVVTFNQPVIKYTDYYYGWLGTQAYIRILDQFKNDSSVAGVVMNVDSGGGQVYGTPEFFEYINDFTSSKPLVVYTGGYLCSGAYYFAAGASWIVAHNRADAIGSIGAYTVLVNYNGIWEKFGAKIRTMYSSLSDEKNKNYRAVMDKEDPDLKQYIKEELDPIVQTFITDMKSVRPQLKEEVFKGGTWTGDKSVEMGLADENGTLETAVSKAFELASKSESNKSNNKQNSKKKTMSKKTKSFPVLQKLIGVKGEGIDTIATLTGKKGVQITEEQLGQIETELADKDKAVTTANGKVTTANGKVTTLETAVNAAITAAGLDADVTETTTTEEKITLLSSKVVEYGKLSSGKGTTPAAEGDTADAADDDANSTSIYKSLIK